MKLRWNNTTAFIAYLVIGLIGAAILRLSCRPKDNTLPVGKTIHLMPIQTVPKSP